ncbi:MAG: class I tRNA ligase family protein, partial [Bacteroidia bacterium]|nr:class I tRNA ligase family protein [Bacteroidia bacterium]
NIRDWIISRQLMWGQQIPAYYYGDGKDDFVVAENKEAALKLVRERTSNLKLQVSDLTQDSDVFDTWFSSWLWPISVFDGIRNPDNKEIGYYYPTNDLVTAPDIIFFWVARMIIAGYEFRQKKPFQNVYFTGLVRDTKGRKMSKQLGNSPDALKLIDQYGADGVRVGMLLLSSGAGNDLLFDEDKCQQGKAFANKIWNAFRLINGWEVNNKLEQPNSSKIALKWFESKLNMALLEIDDHFTKFRISDALMATYKLIWDDFASWLLEIVKPSYQQPIDALTKKAVVTFFEDLLKILHPFMPFISEEIWQLIEERTPENALIISSLPEIKKSDSYLINEFEYAKEVVSGIRTIRKEKNISFKETIDFAVLNNDLVKATFDDVIIKLGSLNGISYINKAIDGALSFRVKSNEYYIPVSGAINVEKEIEKLKEELVYTKGFLRSVQKKLTNERFVNNAPEQVVANEKKKEADALAKIETLKASLASLN